MLDIKLIREHKDHITSLLKCRDQNLSVEEVYTLDQEKRQVQQDLDTLRNEKKKNAENFAKAKRAGEPENILQSIQEEAKLINTRLSTLEVQFTACDEKIQSLLLNIPNTPSDTTPIGNDAKANPVIKSFGKKPDFIFTPKPHWDIGVDLEILDFERGVKVSESRFSVLKGMGARMERALINFMLDTHIENGYNEVLTPFLVNETTMIGTGQLPKFREDMYKCADDNLYLIPTAEVPVTNLYSGDVLSEDDLPLRLVAWTPCFRREAGSAGRDTRGLIRQHQFNKVELVKLVHPQESDKEHQHLLESAELILQKLGLHYRVSELCTGDLGFSAKKCYDIEVWMPSADGYVEISSCSNFGDYQARRANLKYKPSDKNQKNQYLHTLNGSGLAVGRTLATILENYQQPNGSVIIPDVLRKYMNNKERIEVHGNTARSNL